MLVCEGLATFGASSHRKRGQKGKSKLHMGDCQDPDSYVGETTEGKQTTGTSLEL